MSKPTVSDSIVQVLADMGVNQIFGVPGGALNSFNDAIRRSGRIKWIAVRNEDSAAFAANAQARLTGQLGVCAGTVGPGAVHLLNGLYDAKRDAVPVLAITGQVPLAEIGTEAHQEVDLDVLFRDVSVYNQTIVSPAQMPRLVEIAAQQALAQRGVATITIPGDVGGQPATGGRLAHRIFAADPPTRPADDELDEAAAILNGAKSVTMFCGIGCVDAREQVLATAETLKAPIAAALRGKDILEHDNPAYIGQSGLIGNPSTAHAFDDCEALLVVGTDFPYTTWYPSNKKVVQIDIDAGRLGRRVHVDAGLAGHACATLDALLPRLTAKTDDAHRASAQKRYSAWKREQAEKAKIGPLGGVIGNVEEKLTNPDAKIRPEAVARMLSEMSGEGTIFAADTGMCIVWASRFLEMKRGQRLLASFNHGSMANALPQAIGAQALYPGRQVISMSGDGGFTMLMGDFITAVSYELPIKVIVFNNGCYGMVAMEQQVAGSPKVAVELKNPDFARVAEACGATGIRIEAWDELEPGLRRALDTDGPVLVDVLTNPNELSMPPKVQLDQAWGFAISQVKEFIGGSKS